MSMFDKLRSSLGIKPKVFRSGAGHTLGGPEEKEKEVSSISSLHRSSSTGSNSSSNKVSAPSSPRSAGSVREGGEYEVTFAGPTLGLTFMHPLTPDGKPDTTALRDLEIHCVISGSESDKLGVRAGDVVLVVAGNPVDCYDSFVMLVQALGRPLPVRLRRGISAASGGGGTLSAAELAERREMNQRAADARGSAWEKRVQMASSKRKGEEKGRGDNGGAGANAHPEAARKGDSNPATRAAAALARREEELQAQRNGGFNAFQPHMSFSSASGGGVGAAPTLGTSSSASSSAAQDVFAGTGGGARGRGREGESPYANAVGLPITEEAIEDTDLALGLLLSVEVDGTEGGCDAESVGVCVSTVCKLLGNLTGSNGEEKYRSIRMANTAIKSRVLSVPGGLQLMLAAGFVEHDGVFGADAERVLKHSYDPESEVRARFVLEKLTQLQ